MNKRIFIIRIVAVILLIGIMATVFFFSSQPDKKSSKESGSVTKKLCRTFYPKFKSMTKPEQKKIVKKVHPPVRKLAHFTLFFLLGAAAFLSIITYNQIRYRYRIASSFVFSVLYAASDEIHQLFVAGRGPRAADVLIDSAGVALAIIILYFIFKIKAINRFFGLEGK